MPNYRRVARISAGFFGVMLVVAPPVFLQARPETSDARHPQTAAYSDHACCFTNPEYTGVCVVDPGEGETCASILAYLNNPRSQGKSFCGNTSVRGGWKHVSCEKSDLAAGVGTTARSRR